MEASPYVTLYVSRKQAEELMEHLHSQGKTRWLPWRRHLARALNQNSGGRIYAADRAGWTVPAASEEPAP